MVCFQTRNDNFGTLYVEGRIMEKFMSIWYTYYMAVWYIIWPFGILYGHLVYNMAIWYIIWPFGILYGHLVYYMAINMVYFSRVGQLYQENSGNP
jgi:hypothetical protein